MEDSKKEQYQCYKCKGSFPSESGGLLFIREKKYLCPDCSKWYRDTLHVHEQLFIAAFLDTTEETINAWHNCKMECPDKK